MITLRECREIIKRVESKLHEEEDYEAYLLTCELVDKVLTLEEELYKKLKEKTHGVLFKKEPQ